MTTTSKLKVISACLKGLHDAGYDVEESADYAGSVARMKHLGKSLTPMMSHAFNDFSEGNCFWSMLLYEGEVIGGIAARLDRLGNERLGSHWRRQSERIYGGGTEAQLAEVSKFIDEDVYGDMVYFGDLVLAVDHRGRGSHLRFFTVYCHMLASVMWDADWQYSFIPEVHAHSGLGYQHGFAKTIPGAQRWIDPPKGRSSSEVCVINSRVDLADIARHFSRFPEQLRIVKN